MKMKEEKTGEEFYRNRQLKEGFHSIDYKIYRWFPLVVRIHVEYEGRKS